MAENGRSPHEVASELHPYLSGDSVDVGLRLPIGRFSRSVPDRFSSLRDLCTGKRVLHVGCADHYAVIDEKMCDGTWLHGRLVEWSETCAGVDVDAKAIAALVSRGVQGIHCVDLLSEDIPDAIAGTAWDYVLLGEMLEHVDEPVRFLRSLREARGLTFERIIITVPNALSLFGIRSGLKGVECVNSDHRCYFSPYTLGKVMHRAGFVYERYQLVQRYALPSHALLSAILLRLFPAFRSTVLGVGRKAP